MFSPRVWVFCFLEIFAVQTLQADNTYEATVRLERMLLKDYKKEVRPVVEYKDNVTITVGISLYLIKNLDDKDQIITTSLWIRQMWNDSRLAWEPSNFLSVKSIHLSADAVWVPDIKVYNEVDRRRNSGLDQFHTRVVVDYLGGVKWMGPIVIRSSCQVDIRLFPYDTQTCKMKIGSWTYDGFAVDIKPESYTMDISKSPSNPEWELVSTSVQRNVGYYPCCPEPYPDVTYHIKIKRRVQSYWINFIFPGILLTMMTMLTFVTAPSDTGERVSLVLTSLVSMFFFITMIAERTPTSDTIPLLSSYFVMLSLEIVLIFYSVCVSLNTYHKQPALGDMPRYVRTIVLEKLGAFWGLTKDGHDIRRKLEALQHSLPMKDTITGETIEIVDNSPEQPSSTTDNPASRNQNTCHNRVKKPSTEVFPIALVPSASEFQTAGIKSPEDKPITSVNSIIPQGNDILSETNTQGETSQFPSPNVSILQHGNTNQRIQGPRCICSSLLEEMVSANERLLTSVQEILLVARQVDKKSSDKEHWLIAASILDRAFLALFVLSFIALSLVNFLM